MMVLGLGLLSLLAASLLVLLTMRIRRSILAIREEHDSRPKYEFGTSVTDWEEACHKSLEWSQGRRNGTEVKS